jgi:hypothetical protein
MNEETISINLYDVEEFDSPDIKETETVIQDAHSAVFLMDNDSENFDASEIENSDDVSSNFGGFFHG